MPSFLNNLVGARADEFLLINRQTKVVVATRLIPAFDSKSRRTGLLKHKTLEEGVAMLIAPSNSIHTFFMRFPIDVAFVAKDGRILKVKAGLRPWSLAASWRAHAVVEMAEGAIARVGVRPGDVLVVVRRTDEASSQRNTVAHV